MNLLVYNKLGAGARKTHGRAKLLKGFTAHYAKLQTPHFLKSAVVTRVVKKKPILRTEKQAKQESRDRRYAELYTCFSCLAYYSTLQILGYFP
jgi:hypothetical protein